MATGRALHFQPAHFKQQDKFYYHLVVLRVVSCRSWAKTTTQGAVAAMYSPREARAINSLKEGESWEGVCVKGVTYSKESKDCSFHTHTNTYAMPYFQVVNHYLNSQLYNILV